MNRRVGRGKLGITIARHRDKWERKDGRGENGKTRKRENEKIGRVAMKVGRMEDGKGGRTEDGESGRRTGIGSDFGSAKSLSKPLDAMWKVLFGTLGNFIPFIPNWGFWKRWREGDNLCYDWVLRGFEGRVVVR